MLKLTRKLTRTIGVAALGLGVLGIVPTASAWLAPEPRPVPTRWEFTFEDGPLRLAWVETEGVSRPYFYLTYRITNFWGTDLLFAPDVTLVTSDSEVLRSGRDVPSAVTDEIIRRLRNPLLESQVNIVSTVLEGPEHARDGVVIWPATSLQVDELTVFFAGLSGEYESYVIGRGTSEPRRYSLRKTMMLRYATPGDFTRQGSRPFEVIERRWVMR
ncbi:MAG: hypothetical protein LAT64_01885 [Phycisphaerales bacterium]|nr:hypothetical protein [Planctomycetota bacterium]MCH8507510.1 hypothetical protein [Phycisphaerales bacterium]